MKSLRTILTLLLAFISMQAMSQKVLIDDIYYSLNAPNPGEATVMPTGNGNSSYSGDIIIPETVTCEGKTYTVTVIGENAFKGSNITSISIPSTVRILENKALFQATTLVTIRCNALTPPDVAGELSFQQLKGDKVTLIVPGQSIQLYADHEYWKRFIKISGNTTEGTEDVIVMTNYEIIDSQEMFLEKPYAAATLSDEAPYNEFHFVSYIRNFKNTNWQALYVPIELVYSDWSDKFEIAKIHSIQETDGMFYAMADILEENAIIEPHTPYLIRAKEAGEHTIHVSKSSGTDKNNNPLYKVYTSSYDSEATAPTIATSESFTGNLSNATYTFTGQYDTDYYANDGGTYALASGALCQPTAGKSVRLGAFRWVLKVTPAEGGALFTAGSITSGNRNSINGSTQVEQVPVDLNEIEGLDIFYDLSGRRVENPTNGVYIKNGKKILVK